MEAQTVVSWMFVHPWMTFFLIGLALLVLLELFD
jgi:hypothetical protein